MARPKLLACLFVALFALGACAQDEPTVPEADETDAPTPTVTAVAVQNGAPSVVVDDNEEHGEILVDAEGMTLYAFKNDSGGKSSCTGGCAETWPPLTVEGEPNAGDGVDEEKLGTTDRDDDSTQVTYNDHPLYTYSGDDEAGETNGHGVGDVWYVVSADGEPMESM